MAWWNGNHQPFTSRPVKLTSNIFHSTSRLVSWNSGHGHMMVFRLDLCINGFSCFSLICFPYFTFIVYAHLTVVEGRTRILKKCFKIYVRPKKTILHYTQLYIFLDTFLYCSNWRLTLLTLLLNIRVSRAVTLAVSVLFKSTTCVG